MSRWMLPLCGLVIVLGNPGSAQVTQIVSLDSTGAQGNDDSSSMSAVSSDGRYVAFASWATNLVPGDTNGWSDVFVRDRQSGTTERVSIASGGAEGDGPSAGISISADGRYVAFSSAATNLVPGDFNFVDDIFIRDRQNGTTERVSLDSGGAEADDASSFPSISGDGRFVAYSSFSTNLVLGDTNGPYPFGADVFVRDRQSGTTERVSVDSGGAEGNDNSGEYGSSISADGLCVAFQSLATNLVPGDTSGFNDVFVHDRQSGTTGRVSVDSGGTEGNGDSSDFDRPTLSADGRFVAFASLATNLVPGDTNAGPGFIGNDAFVRDRQLGTTERVSVASGGAQGTGGGSGYAAISSDSRFVAFMSGMTNLVPGNPGIDIFVHERQSGTTERVSVNWAGVQGNNSSSPYPSISADGRFVAFDSYASNLIPFDIGNRHDIFVRDRVGGTSFTSLCDPGLAGVQACPCSNAPSGSGRGCNNSASTGGAILAASGGTYLSSDSLVFTTSGEKPTATSIVLQGTTSPAAGIIYGQGVRCVGGSLKRLYTKSAVGGSITAPDLAGGDMWVSMRSAVKGDVISAGQSRWYLVFYRDPTVLGGCPASSTFNATQTGRVTWSP